MKLFAFRSGDKIVAIPAATVDAAISSLADARINVRKNDLYAIAPKYLVIDLTAAVQ